MHPLVARPHPQVIRQETARRPSRVQAPRLLGFIRISPRSFLLSVQRELVPRKPVQRKLICFAVAFNLLLWPGPGLASQHILSLVSRALDMRVGFSNSYEAYFVRSLFSQSPGVTQHETMADRASAVAHIHLNPVKFVGYVDETVTFTALATDFLDRTIQGVKFSWDESDQANKLRMDEAGRATFLHPGLARITCRAGSVVATAAVLIRPNHRPVQSDAEWRADQASLSVTGNTTGKLSQPVTSFLSSLLDRLAPTAYAQSGPYYGNDLAYDQLWSEPRNLVGSPPNRAIEPTALGTVQPESSNFDLAIPLISLGGRGLAANLMLNYNSRVWGRHGNAVTFDPIASWPTPGFSLGFGRIVPYELSYGVGKFLLVEPDGTRRYLGASNPWCSPASRAMGVT